MSKIFFSKALVDLIAGCIFDGLTDEETALLSGVSSKTIYRVRLGDTCPAIKVATLQRKRHYIALIRDGDDRTNHWQRIAWFLERRYPTEFAKPEVQLQLNTGNTTNNTIVITAEQASGLRSRSSAIESELTKLTPPNQRNVQVSDKLGPNTKERLRLDKANEFATHNINLKGVEPEREDGHSHTRTPGPEPSQFLPQLSGKLGKSDDSSNSKLPPQLSGKSEVSESSSNYKLGRPPRKKEEILKEAIRKAAVQKKKARGEAEGLNRGASRASPKGENRSGVPS